jgi:hypothetical protein
MRQVRELRRTVMRPVDLSRHAVIPEDEEDLDAGELGVC